MPSATRSSSHRLSANNLVIVNALATYARMFLCAGLSLLSSRWILAALGQTDFGLYAVVAGVMGFLSFLTGAMTGSAQRHFAFALGQGDIESVNRWFNASLLLHVGLALVLGVVGWPFGWYMLHHVLVIPHERLATCLSVLGCTMVTVVAHVLAVPFTGMFTAKQRIFESSIYQIVQVALLFVFAYALTSIRTDRLFAYAVGVMAISLLLTSLQIARCWLGFKECRPKRLKRGELHYVRELVSFAGWNLFGALGAIGSNQGMAFLINIFCGPRINASFGIANQVGGQVAGVSQGLFNALAPEITASEGRGNRGRVISLALRASKFSVLLIAFLLIPVLFELDAILGLWLKEVPPFTATLCRIALIAFLIDKLTIGYMVAVAAHGRIAGYQATLGGALLLAPLVAWAVFMAGGSVVWAVGAGLIATRTVCSLGRVWWVRRLMQVPMRRWFWAVPVRSALVTAVPIGLAVLIRSQFGPSLMRLALTLVTTTLTLAAAGWFVGLDQRERDYLADVLKKGGQAVRRAVA